MNTLCFFGMSDSLRFKRAVVFVFLVQKVERRLDRLSNGACHGWKERFPPLLLLFRVDFSSRRRTSTGEVSLSLRSHVARIVNRRIVMK